MAKSSREFTIGDILNVLEGDLLLIDIENDENEIENFMSENLWNVINNKIINFFNSITLEDLVNDYKNTIEKICIIFNHDLVAVDIYLLLLNMYCLPSL